MNGNMNTSSDILILLSILRNRATEIRNKIGRTSSVIDAEYCEVEVTINHLSALEREARKPLERRVASIIASSWALVSSRGKKYGLFNEIQGNEKFREALVKFLNNSC
jgi:hypothetical protein